MDKKTKQALKGISVVGDRVLVLPEKPEEKTKGGIILVEAAQEKRFEIAEVLVKGSGEYADQVEVGQKVYYNSFARHDLPKGDLTLGIVDGEDLRLSFD